MNATTNPIIESIPNAQPILIIGGTGKTGRRVAERLTVQGLPVRIGSRSSATPFDWENPSTWRAALRNASAAYIAYSPDLAAPGATESIRELTRLAKEEKVAKLVLLSGRGEPEAQACEQIVIRSGLEWTIVRCSWFNQNFNENFLLESVLNGVIALPAGDVSEPFVDADDIAEVAANALIDDRHNGELYELTGPESLTFHDIASELSLATGREIRFHSIPSADFVAGLNQAGLPEDLITLLDYLTRVLLDGRNSQTTNGVQLALGREARSFRQYAQCVASSGQWDLPDAMELAS